MANNRLQTGTSKGQRIAIWAILILTVGSTIALYAASFLQQKNERADTQKYQEAIAKYQADYEKYTAKREAQAKELSAKYYDSFKDYEKYPSAFNAASVNSKTDVEKNDLKVGDGAEITDETEYSAYYIGWKSDGTVFDGSFENGALKIPFTITAASSMIEGWSEGWSEGVKGMKIGGIREISIPSAKAYGEAGQPNSQDSSKSIGANEPLKFVVFAIPKIEEIPQPDPASYDLGV